MANDLPTDYADGRIIHGADVDAWMTAINAKSTFMGQVASQSAMLALQADPGDFCERTDLGNAFYYLIADPATTLGNWGTPQAVSSATATRLATPRNINGVAFDGTANITITDSTAEKTANKNAANGYAGLDGSGKVASAQLPSLVPWSGGTPGLLPATSGQHLTTQGGNTLDDGSGHVAILGGTLDGVTIGGSTAAPSITANAFLRGQTTTAASTTPITLAASSTQVQIITGTTTAQTVVLPSTGIVGGYECVIINQMTTASVTVTSSSGTTVAILAPFEHGLFRALYSAPTAKFQWSVSGSHLEGVTIGDVTPAGLINAGQVQAVTTLANATGNLTGVAGAVTVNGGTGLGSIASWLGVAGHSTTGVNLGGTSPSPIGSFWGGWFTAGTTGGTYHRLLAGIEVDVQCLSNSVQKKIGVSIILGGYGNDSVRGSLDDTALCIARGTSTTSWQIGVKLGTDQSSTPSDLSTFWPFASDSTIIGTCAVGNGLPANIGIDFSLITFTDCAIKTGPAPIQMGAMASAPATPASGKGKLYVASDGSLHFVGASGTDTRLAVA